MDSEFSKRARIRMGMSLDEPMVQEEVASPAKRAREDLYTGPPQGFRVPLIKGVAIAGAAVGGIGLILSVLLTEVWAVLVIPGMGLAFYALRMANDDLQVFGENLQEPYLTQLRFARTYAIVSLGIIGGLLALLVLAMIVTLIFSQATGVGVE